MKPARVIRNPYAATAKRDEVGKKRVRPWEANQPERAPKEQTLPHSRPSATQSPVVREQVQSTEDSFDGGIDWDAALKTLEDQAVFETARAPLPTNPTPTTGNAASTKKQLAVGNSSGSTALPSKEPPVPSKHVIPAKENSLASNAASTAALSDLRPSSWKVLPQTSLGATRTVPVATSGGTTTSAIDNMDPDQRDLPKVLRFQPKDVAPQRDEYQRELVKHANVGAPLLNGWTLYSHQKKAILKGLAMRRSIIALDMGLGKSLVGAVWARAFVLAMECHVVVLCPVSLQEEWKRTMEQAVGLNVKDLTGTTKKKAAASSASAAPSVSIHSWSKIPSDIEETYGDFVVVADEAHSIQSMQAARTKDTLKLVSSPLCEGVLLLTGTPMKNGKPSNLFPLLKAVKHPLGRNQKAYEAHFCGGREVNFGRGRVWQANGANNLETLRRLTKSHVLHLTKEACLKDLPPLSRVFIQVPVSSRRQMQHNHALQELAKIYESQRTGPDEQILGAVQKVRMVGSLAKVEAAVEQAKKILLEQPAVVIFTSFQEVAKQVHKKLAEAGWEGEILTGETPAKKRQGMVDKFQQCLSPVFCCTFGAGGVGLTLTAAHTVILLDRPWTPGDAHQAEDRVRRIGQTKPVKSIWLRSFDLDTQIDSILEQKKQTAAAVLTETSGASDESHAAPRLSIFQMLKSVLPESTDALTQTSILQFSQAS